MISMAFCFEDEMWDCQLAPFLSPDSSDGGAASSRAPGWRRAQLLLEADVGMAAHAHACVLESDSRRTD